MAAGEESMRKCLHLIGWTDGLVYGWSSFIWNFIFAFIPHLFSSSSSFPSFPSPSLLLLPSSHHHHHHHHHHHPPIGSLIGNSVAPYFIAHPYQKRPWFLCGCCCCGGVVDTVVALWWWCCWCGSGVVVVLFLWGCCCCCNVVVMVVLMWWCCWLVSLRGKAVEMIVVGVVNVKVKWSGCEKVAVCARR